MKTSSKFSMGNLISVVKSAFSTVPEGVSSKSKISIADCLMSGLAIFSLKYPSLLQFEQGRKDKVVEHNLKKLFLVDEIPSDTYMRERLDEVEPVLLRKAFSKIFALLQRGKHLEKFAYINGHHLVSIDGTGFHSSRKVHCDTCCTLLEDEGNYNLKLRVYITGGGCAGFQYGFAFDENVSADDIIISRDNPNLDDPKTSLKSISVAIDPLSMTYLEGATLDYAESLQGAHFFITNPNAQTTCGCGSSFGI